VHGQLLTTPARPLTVYAGALGCGASDGAQLRNNVIRCVCVAEDCVGEVMQLYRCFGTYRKKVTSPVCESCISVQDGPVPASPGQSGPVKLKSAMFTQEDCMDVVRESRRLRGASPANQLPQQGAHRPASVLSTPTHAQDSGLQSFHHQSHSILPSRKEALQARNGEPRNGQPLSNLVNWHDNRHRQYHDANGQADSIAPVARLHDATPPNDEGLFPSMLPDLVYMVAHTALACVLACAGVCYIYTKHIYIYTHTYNIYISAEHMPGFN
jgi:hypothetical protein